MYTGVYLLLFPVPAFADDRLTICSRNQEAALNTLRQSYGAGYGKPIPGSATDKRSAHCNFWSRESHVIIQGPGVSESRHPRGAGPLQDNIHSCKYQLNMTIQG